MTDMYRHPVEVSADDWNAVCDLLRNYCGITGLMVVVGHGCASIMDGSGAVLHSYTWNGHSADPVLY
jgi:hypothetical protein